MESINWKCDGECNEQLGTHSYAMLVSNVQVLEVDDEGRITASTSTGQQDEQLCYSCFTKKYKDRAEDLDAALRHCLREAANAVELLEAESNDDFYNPKATLDKLNELVVYIAGQLHPKEGEA